MKLKTVTLEFEFVIAVEDDDKAEETARDHILDAVRDMSTFDFDLIIRDYKKGGAQGWDDDCIPYGGDGNTRTGDYCA